MSLKPQSARPIPAETARVAEAAFPKRNVYMRMRDQFGELYATEACDEDLPHLITDVQTTPATQPDSELLPRIQADLAQRDLLPAEQLADAGYVTAEHLVNSQRDHQVTLLGPVGLEPSWRAKTPQGVSVATFVMGWDAHHATCPQGHQSAL